MNQDKSTSEVKKNWKTVSPSRLNDTNNESIIGQIKESSKNLIQLFKQ